MIFKHAAFLLQKSNFLLENNLGLKQPAISKSTVHYLFSEQPRISARRYKNFLKCKLLKKDNSLRIDTSATYSIHSRVRIRLEHLTKHAIVQFVNQILGSFEYNKYILGDFIELSKAFDKLTETLIV